MIPATGRAVVRQQLGVAELVGVTDRLGLAAEDRRRRRRRRRRTGWCAARGSSPRRAAPAPTRGCRSRPATARTARPRGRPPPPSRRCRATGCGPNGTCPPAATIARAVAPACEAARYVVQASGWPCAGSAATMPATSTPSSGEVHVVVELGSGLVGRPAEELAVELPGPVGVRRAQVHPARCSVVSHAR